MNENAIRGVLGLLFNEIRPIPDKVIKENVEKLCSIMLGSNVDDVYDAVINILKNPRPLSEAVRAMRINLPIGRSLLYSELENAVNSIIVNPHYAGLDKEAIIREAEANFNVQMGEFRIIEDNERKQPWITEKKDKISWHFWNRYKQYMEEEKNIPDMVITQLDKLTEKTLDCLFDPEQKIILSKYGLVVGQVQSGKTSNYTGLICKAADAGFKMIIILAGVHNNLRSQTQLRIDEGFLGFDTQHERAFNSNGIKIGVGKYNDSAIAHSLTSSLDKGDFTRNAANALGINFNTTEPIIAIVKKNSHVLKRLVGWLTAQSKKTPDGVNVIKSKSLLLIDDEADNASINTNPSNKTATAINTQIRNIIQLFDKSAYVGYTATPFANIFIPIEKDDLFPRDFIINIPTPSNYIGPEKIFGTGNQNDYEDTDKDVLLPIVQRIDDFNEIIPQGQQSIHVYPQKIPQSLERAIKCFILTCAIRRLRRQKNSHNSMLIHISRFVAWQENIKYLVEKTFESYQNQIEMNDAGIYQELRNLYELDSDNYTSYKTVSLEILTTQPELDPQAEVHDWDQIVVHIKDAAKRIQVKSINGGSGDVLNYYDHSNDGISVIAIGGDKLSRGLTLEGLSVSYYLRASKMYDTLMQMGRWFGYRPGYVDLCRLFTSQELNEWFCHITLASDELRREFDYMSNIANSTPVHYALKVRTHPGVLQISASNKIREAMDVNISWSGRLVETYQLKKDSDTLLENLNVVEILINSIKDLTYNYTKQLDYVWKKSVSSDKIIEFLSRFILPDSLQNVNPLHLIDFINACVKVGELTKWSVAIMSKTNADTVYKNIDGFEIGCFIRSDAKDRSDESTYFIKKNHIISPQDESIDLDDEVYKDAVEKSNIARIKDKQKINNYPKGDIVRNEFRNPTNPLLIIYFLDPKGAFGEIATNETPIVGFAISFPKSISNPTVSYAVHRTLLSRFDVNEDYFDESENEDED